MTSSQATPMEQRDSWSSQSFGTVEICWRPLSNRFGFDVTAAWGGSLFLEATLSKAHPDVVFSVRSEDETSGDEVVGRFVFSRGRVGVAILTLDLRYPGGEVTDERLAPSPTPLSPPPPPPDPEPEPDVTIVDDAGRCDLFPYVYLRPWPEISPEALEDRFVTFSDDCSKPDDDLYGNLVKIRTPGGNDLRLKMEKEAKAFIEGGASFLGEPYQGVFVESMATLLDHLDRLAPLDRQLRNRDHITFRKFQAEVIEVLDLPWKERDLDLRWQQVGAWIRKTKIQNQLDLVWQSFFALAILSGYRTRLRQHLTLTLVMANLLERTTEDEPLDLSESEEADFPSDDDETAEMPVLSDTADLSEVEAPVEPPPPVWPSRRILEGAKATIILPRQVWPLPPNGEVPPLKPDGARVLSLLLEPVRPRSLSGSIDSGWVEPYAIGDLERVRQRLAGYELGEVSSIENVLSGSQKETTQRNLQRNEEVREEAVTTDETNESSNEDLQNEVHRVLLGTLSLSGKYSSTYGPPTDAKVTNKFSQDLKHTPKDESTQPYAEDFAKTITSLAANRVSRSVVKRRSTSSLQENEETVVHRFDASQSAENMTGIYRWVNKVYAMEVVNYGHRLLLEFPIPNPAESYIQSELALHGVSLEEPTPLDQLGVRNYTDISTNPKSRQYYASLASRYRAPEVEPPPVEELTVSITMQAGAPLGAQVLEVPAGYRAAEAVVTANWSDALTDPSFFGVVGSHPFSFPSEGDDPKRIELELASETGTIPVAIESGSSDQGDGAPSTEFLATIEGRAVRSKRLFEQWQTETYALLVDAYSVRREEYFAAAGASSAEASERNPLASREAERKSLHQDVVLRLLRLAVERQGIADGDQLAVDGDEVPPQSPPPFEVNQPRYYQFLDHALEWNEMTYSFAVYGEKSAGETSRRLKSIFSGSDSVFTAFLQATDARVLVPVRPAFVFRMLYFLAAGVIWHGDDPLTPSNQQSIELVNDWKMATASRHDSRVVGMPWKVRVPTSMVKLQDSPDLPCLNRG